MRFARLTGMMAPGASHRCPGPFPLRRIVASGPWITGAGRVALRLACARSAGARWRRLRPGMRQSWPPQGVQPEGGYRDHAFPRGSNDPHGGYGMFPMKTWSPFDTVRFAPLQPMSDMTEQRDKPCSTGAQPTANEISYARLPDCVGSRPVSDHDLERLLANVGHRPSRGSGGGGGGGVNEAAPSLTRPHLKLSRSGSHRIGRTTTRTCPRTPVGIQTIDDQSRGLWYITSKHRSPSPATSCCRRPPAHQSERADEQTSKM
jgi:hypothetical protein